jgi:Raf kinase inhibitor-like YbhB/YbcL family protein
MTFILTSPAFANGEPIPPRHAKGGDNVSPPLAWEDVPAGTRSFALILEDPEAPFVTVHHWAVYDIPGDARALPEGLPDGAERIALKQAVNTYGNAHYDGPQPPPLHGTHHYHFRLLALKVPTRGVGPDPTVDILKAAAAPAAIAEAQLIGTFKKTLFGNSEANEGAGRHGNG